MKQALEKHWPLLLVLIVFILFKVPHLHYPYYWDESGIFAPGAVAMYRHGPTLMPGAIGLYFSRGHPQLFYASAALWINMFGHSHMAMHCFALFISLLLIILVYQAGLRLFGLQVAVISIMLLTLNETFFVQSSFVIPDTMIALLSFSTLYFYATRQYICTALSFTMLFYTKESAILLAVVLCTDALITAAHKNIPLRGRLFGLASVFIPIALGGIFYIIQKHTMGWYLAPAARSSHPDFDLGHALYWYRVCLNTLFYPGHKYLLFIVLLLLSLLAAIKQRNIKYAFLLLPFAILYFLANTNNSYKELVSTALLLLFIFSVVLSVYALKYFKFLRKGFGSPALKFTMLAAVFFVAYLYYFTIYDFQARYMLSPMVILCILAAVFAAFLISASYPSAFYFTLIFILGAGISCFLLDNGYGELSAFNGMAVQQDIVDYCEQHDLYHKTISAGSYLDVIQLQNPDCGYLHTPEKFDHVLFGKYNPNSEYVIFENIDSSGFYNDCKHDTSFHRVFRSGAGKKWAEIYARK